MDKSKKKIEESIRELSEVISELDNLRWGFYVSPRKIDRKINKLPYSNVKSIWKKGRKEILGLETSLTKEEKFRRYASLSALFRNLSIISISFIGFAFAMFYADPNRFAFLIPIATNPIVVIIAIIVIPNAYFITDYLAREYVKNMFLRTKKVERKRRLKTVIEEYLEILVEQMKRNNIDRNKIKMKLFYTDYKNIEIVKKPSRFRKYYIAIPKF